MMYDEFTLYIFYENFISLKVSSRDFYCPWWILSPLQCDNSLWPCISSYVETLDRRNVLMNITTGIPPKLLQLNGMMRTVEATNNENNLRIYLSFSAPVLNSSTEILRVLRTSSGSLSPTYRNSLGNHRFGYIVSYSLTYWQICLSTYLLCFLFLMYFSLF